MKLKRLWQLGMAGTAGLAVAALMVGATAFSASTPAGPSITVYRSPT